MRLDFEDELIVPRGSESEGFYQAVSALVNEKEKEKKKKREKEEEKENDESSGRSRSRFEPIILVKFG